MHIFLVSVWTDISFGFIFTCVVIKYLMFTLCMLRLHDKSSHVLRKNSRVNSYVHTTHNLLYSSKHLILKKLLKHNIIYHFKHLNLFNTFNYIQLPNCLVFDRKSRPWTKIMKLYITLTILFLLHEQELRDKNSSIGCLQLWF